ncbi:MAG: hypothetical protein HRT44_09295, partial [Bdellovibrionales bacterium]|nr:hypothetical protein [Bdellovibrionales bacterium]NQZ19434.1 hypothetical protein [Bdellovibrionales bacterium]
SYKAELFKSSSERFNEEIEYGGTEAEFHRRLESQGIAMIYLPKLKVTHNPEITESNLVEKARKQALATFKYDIDRGDNKLNMKSYQKSTQIWALKSSTNRGQYQKLLYLIDLYDWAYQKVIQEPEISLRNLKWSSYFWKRSKKKSIGRMVF